MSSAKPPAVYRAKTKEEKRLLEICQLGKVDYVHGELLAFLDDNHGININVTDSDGATALHHAAYKGNVQACSLLLSRGAEVNWCQHNDKYTPLMFSMLSGSPETTRLLLEAGADRDVRNSAGRNAFQVGVSIAQYGCIAVVKNHVPTETIKRYSSKRASEQHHHKFPSIPDELVEPVQRLVSTTDIHPVRVILDLQCCEKLLRDHTSVCSILLHLMEEKFADDHNFLAFKLHYISSLVQSCTATENSNKLLLKRLLQASSEQAGRFPEVDGYLRQCLREYKYAKSCPIAIRMIQTLSSIPIGGEPSTFSVTHDTIISRRSEEETECATCGRSTGDMSRCSKCKKVFYCGAECQRLAWTIGNHKKLCKLWRDDQH